MLKRREQAICKCCGQRMLVRHGVRLSPLLADLFDMVERCGDGGITCETLGGIFYPGKNYYEARNCVHANIFRINSLLAETDFEVHAKSSPKGDAPYRVIKRRNP